MSEVRSFHNICDGWGTLTTVPAWLEGRAEITWSTRLMGYRIHITDWTGDPATAQPGDWLLIDKDNRLHIAKDGEHEALALTLNAKKI